MKKTTKTILCIAGAFVIIGAILFGVAASMVGFNFRKLSTGVTLEEKYYMAEPGAVDLLTIDTSNTDIVFKPSSDGKIHLTYYESERDYYTVTEKNGELRLAYVDKRNWKNFIVFDIYDKHTVTVELPTRFDGRINAQTSNDSIDAAGLTFSGDVMLTTSNGPIKTTNLTLDRNLNLKTSNSSLTVSGLKIGGDLTVESSNGKIDASDLTVADTFDAKTNNSRIESVNVRSGKVKFKTSNGDIKLEKLYAEESISLDSSNNSIKGSIDDSASNFTITKSETSNARNNLPTGFFHGPKTLSVDTSNGDIDLQFLR